MLVFRARPRKDPTESPALTNSERRVMRILGEAMREVRAQVIRDEGKILDAVMHSGLDKIANLVTVEPWLEAQPALQEELLAELISGGQRVKLPAMQKATMSFGFDATRPEAARWAEKEAGQLIVEVVEEQRQVVRGYVSSALMGEYTPQQVARGLRSTIGLTQQQAGWVENFRQRQIDQRMAAGRSFDQAFAESEKATQQYHDRIHKYRTETIARTEILRASAEGRKEAWQQGVEEGFIDPSWVKTWSTEQDARTCDECGPLDGETAPVLGDFPWGDPPLHPNCRCTLLLEEPKETTNEFADLTDDELEELIMDLMDEEQVTIADIDSDESGSWTDEQRGAIDELEFLTNQMNMIDDIEQEADWINDLRRGVRDSDSEYFKNAAQQISDYTLDSRRTHILNNEEANFLLDNAGVVKGTLHRGMQASDEVFAALQESKIGQEIDMRGVSSFSRDPEVADMYARGTLGGGGGFDSSRPVQNPVIIRTQGEVRGIPIEALTEYGEEDEVLVRRNMRVVSVTPTQIAGTNGLEIVVEQIP